jgi:uncharacterized protein
MGLTDLIGLALCGLVSGFLAGLLGIGGGLIVVPVMYLLLPRGLAAEGWLPHMAAATSLAAMIPTSIAALMAQWRNGALEMAWLQRLAPGVVIGALAGAALLPRADPRAVAWAFALYAVYFAARLLLAARGIRLAAPWTRWPTGLIALSIGSASVLVGVGGAIFTVPYLESREVRMATAAATSSAVGLLLSLVAVASLAVQAATQPALASTAASLVWWTGATVVGLCATLTANLGVRAALRWPVARLKRAFALVVAGAAVSAVWKVSLL